MGINYDNYLSYILFLKPKAENLQDAILQENAVRV